MDSEAGKLFVGGIHWNTTDEGLRAYFEQFGQVTESHIMRDPTGKSRCFGFVNFADPSVLDTIVSKTHILDNKQIDPKRAVPKHMQPHPQNPYTPYLAAAGVAVNPSMASANPNAMNVRPGMRAQLKDECKIFVGGIHIAVEEEELKAFFSKYDQVVDVTLMRDHTTGRSRGFGFVTFATTKGVTECVAEKFIEFEGRRMEIKPAQPKGRTAPANPMSNPAGYASMAGAAGMDPAQYAAMAEYYKNYGMTAGAAASAQPGQNPILAAMTAAGYTDPKAYLDAMVQAYSASYGPEMAAQVAAYYAPYLNQATTTTTSSSSSSDKPSSREERRHDSRSRSPSQRSGRRSRSPGHRNYRRGSRDDERSSSRRYRSRSDSRSPPPPPPPPPPSRGDSRRDRDYRDDRSSSPDSDRRSHRRR